MSSTSLEHPADAAPRPVDLLALVAHHRDEADRSEVAILELAVMWADAHPVEPDTVADRRWDVPQPVPAREVTDADRVALSEWHPDLLDTHGELRGDAQQQMVATDPRRDPTGAEDPATWAGVPAVAWDAPAGFAAANRMSTTAAKALIRDALVLRHRLPATWREVVGGWVPAWRARRIAQMCLSQPVDVVAAIDAEIAPVAGSIGPVGLAHRLDAAMLGLHAELRELDQLTALDQRTVLLDEATITHTGLAEMTIRTDWADLADLDGTLTRLAQALTDPAVAARIDPVQADQIARADLSVRKAVAAGALADPDLAADLLRALDQPRQPDEQEPGQPQRSRRARRHVDLVVHLTPDTLRGLDPVADCDQLGPLLTTLVAQWCSRPDTDIHLRPVINLDRLTETTHCHPRSAGGDVDAGLDDPYDISETLRATVALLHPRCVHPYCERPARACDCDHTVPWPHGPTCTHNLAPLCRHHHRLKTHTAWTYHAIDPITGTYHWTSPHGLTFLVDHRGTHPLTE